MNKPNVVIILADDLGYGDCSCYGQTAWTTPHIDRMAEEGIRFTDFYTTSPVCSPARASILTGLNAGRLPIRELKDPYLPDDLMTIPKLLKQAGYTSACVGKYGVGNSMPSDDPFKKGFDYHYGYNCMRHAHNYFPPFLVEDGDKVMLRNRPPIDDKRQWETGVGVAEEKVDYSPDFIEEKALEFMEAHKESPFFLYYCPTMPHANNEGWTKESMTPDGMEVDTYGDFDQYDWLPNEKGFARMVQRLDITVGRVLAKLKELGIAENTLVLFSSDNGPHNEGGHSVTTFHSAGGFKGYKRSLNEGGIRVPFVAWWPGTIEGGQTSEHLGYFPDVINTVCEVTGANKVPYSDGIPLTRLLRGETEQQKKHPYLYFEYQNQRAVRLGHWKYFDDGKGIEGLFNLNEDKHEDHDVKEEHGELFRQLKGYIAVEHKDYDPFPLPDSRK